MRGFGVRVTLIEPTFTSMQLDTHAARTAQQIGAYAASLSAASTAITAQTGSSQGPETVAAEILRAIEAPHRPVGSSARLLNRLRRFMPAGPVDRGLRKTLGLR